RSRVDLTRQADHHGRRRDCGGGISAPGDLGRNGSGLMAGRLLAVRTTLTVLRSAAGIGLKLTLTLAAAGCSGSPSSALPPRTSAGPGYPTIQRVEPDAETLRV